MSAGSGYHIFGLLRQGFQRIEVAIYWKLHLRAFLGRHGIRESRVAHNTRGIACAFAIIVTLQYAVTTCVILGTLSNAWWCGHNLEWGC